MDHKRIDSVIANFLVTETDLRRLEEMEDRWDTFLYAIDKALHHLDRDSVDLDGFDAGKSLITVTQLFLKIMQH